MVNVQFPFTWEKTADEQTQKLPHNTPQSGRSRCIINPWYSELFSDFMYCTVLSTVNIFYFEQAFC